MSNPPLPIAPAPHDAGDGVPLPDGSVAGGPVADAPAGGLTSPARRHLLKSTGLGVGLGVGLSTIALAARAQTAAPPRAPAARPQPAAAREAGGLKRGTIGFVLSHEQFPAAEIIRLAAQATRSGFPLIATSDHFQPWQANQGHSGSAWLTLAAMGAQARGTMGTSVTCPTMRYNPAVVAQGFATLANLYPGRVFLGVGSGEALNEQAATGQWPKWQERWDRLIEAIAVIRELWSGREVNHKGTYYAVDGRLYDPPAEPIPLLTAANGRKSMRLAGQHGDGLITDPLSWKKYKAEWEAGARDAGKDPAAMPVMIEHYVVVGDQAEARQAAENWRFTPNAWKQGHGYFNIVDPAEIERRAEAEVPLDQLIAKWPASSDPAVHIKAVRELFDSGVTHVNIHSGQADQEKVIRFYAAQVLPKFRHPV